MNQRKIFHRFVKGSGIYLMTLLAKKILGCKELKTFWNSNGKQNTIFHSRSNSLLLKQRGLLFDNEQAVLLFRKHKLPLHPTYCQIEVIEVAQFFHLSCHGSYDISSEHYFSFGLITKIFLSH